MRPIFDAHCHIIDSAYPLIPNNGYVPEFFSVDDYLARATPLGIVGGAVVSGSFQGYDQSYLIAALKRLGPGFVGVTQLPASVTDAELQTLRRQGIRALRFNLKREAPNNLTSSNHWPCACMNKWAGIPSCTLTHGNCQGWKTGCDACRR